MFLLKHFFYFGLGGFWSGQFCVFLKGLGHFLLPFGLGEVGLVMFCFHFKGLGPFFVFFGLGEVDLDIFCFFLSAHQGTTI